MPQYIGDDASGRPITDAQARRQEAAAAARKKQDATAAAAARRAPRANTSRTGGRVAVGSAIADKAAELSRAGKSFGINWCLKFVRTTAGAPGGTATAAMAWRQAQYKHVDGSVPPRGSIVYWTGGSKGSGHVAISDGKGNVWSTDIKRPGKVDLVSIADLNRKWGSLKYEGWAEDVNGQRVGHFGGKTSGKDYSDSIAALQQNASRKDDSPGPAGARGGSGIDLQDTWDQDEFEAALAATGFGGALLRSDKELRAKFQQAIREEWSPDRFAGEIRNTHWYRNRSSAQRDYDTKRANDPQTWARELQNRKEEILSVANTMGVRLSLGRLDTLAKSAYRNGLTDDALNRAIASEFDYDPRKTYSGAAGSTISELRAKAAAYGQAPGRYMEDYVTKVLRGEMTMDGLENAFREKAKRDYAHFSKELDAGQTLAEIADPYRQKAAQILELNPEDLSLADKTIAMGLAAKDAKGNTTAMPLWQYEEALKNDERWLKTNNARDSVMSMGRQLLTSFGLAV